MEVMYYDMIALLKLGLLCSLITVPIACLILWVADWLDGDAFKRVKKSKHGWTETIVCPECWFTQKATVTHRKGDPWPTFIHECERCGYLIVESEWGDGK